MLSTTPTPSENEPKRIPLPLELGSHVASFYLSSQRNVAKTCKTADAKAWVSKVEAWNKRCGRNTESAADKIVVQRKSKPENGASTSQVG